MATVLSPANAYNPGSDLWIFPELEESQWTQKVDWYLNFQILKNSQKKSLEILPEVRATLDSCGLPHYSFVTSAETSPLMIISELHLPNKWTIIAPGSKNFRPWIKNMHRLWENLNKPSLRVFLPSEATNNSFVESWNLIGTTKDLTLVLDSQTKVRSNN